MEVKGIGIGAPNGNFYTGCIENAPNLNMKGNIYLAKMMEERLHLPAVITNDANAAAYGEMIYGGAKGMKNFIMFLTNCAVDYKQDKTIGSSTRATTIMNPTIRGCSLISSRLPLLIPSPFIGAEEWRSMCLCISWRE